jgi:hypothetical protein
VENKHIMTKSYVVRETVELPDELLDALEADTDIAATVPAKSNVVITKDVNTYDTAKISDELLDALEDDMPTPVTPITRNPQQPTSVPAKSMVLEEPPFDEEDTAKVRPIRD